MKNLKLANLKISQPDLLEESERRARICLSRSENVGPITFHHLLKQYGSAERALQALPELAQKGGKKRPIKRFSFEELEQELSQHQKFGSSLIVYGDPDYPQMFLSFPDAPPVFTVKGRTSLLHQKTVGIVGARNASLNGRCFAQKISQELGEQGYVVVSGLAQGIDASAHEGSLKTGTLAVIAGGIQDIYPLENAKLYEKITTQGLLMAECPFGVRAQASFFPRRNRLISGLSLGIVIVEATQKSGSLITARFALEQNREVFAVPGSPLDPRCRGTNQLIQEGAFLIQSTQDILDQLERPLLRKMASLEDPPYHLLEERKFLEEDLEMLRKNFLSYLSLTPLSMDLLERECHIPRHYLMLLVLEFELAGKILRHSGNRISLNPVEMEI